jgi:hypothetical protein
MSLTSFISKLEADAAKFEGVAIKDEQEIVAWASKTFGSAPVDSVISNIESGLDTELGKLVQKSVMFIEGSAPAIDGAVKSSTVLALVSSIAAAMGIPFSASAVGALINLAAPFVKSAAEAVARAVLQPAAGAAPQASPAA